MVIEEQDSEEKSSIKRKQICITGARAILILAALSESPKSIEELQAFLLSSEILSKKYSKDTLRADINILKSFGCKISKATKTNDNKYHLISHPFIPEIYEEDIEALKTGYKQIAQNTSIPKLVEFHNLFIHISKLTNNENLKDKILNISILRNDDLALIEKLLREEERRGKIRIIYQPPEKEEREYEITVDRLGVRNEKLYVFGYNHTKKDRCFLNVSRINKFVYGIPDNSPDLGTDTVIRFKLRPEREYVLEDKEVVLERTDDYITVEGRYYNKFIGVQRMLHLVFDVVVIEPKEIKEEILKKLKEMRTRYKKR